MTPVPQAEEQPVQEKREVQKKKKKDIGGDIELFGEKMQQILRKIDELEKEAVTNFQ